jgi:hypothetical protein
LRVSERTSAWVNQLPAVQKLTLPSFHHNPVKLFIFFDLTVFAPDGTPLGLRGATRNTSRRLKEEWMKRLSLVLIGLSLLVLAAPLMASQFVQLPFDQVARESNLIVRGTVENTWSKWDDSGEVIFTYATVRVQKYFGVMTGPDTVVVREVGGTVDGYTQEAIGFPAVRAGEQVVFFLAPTEDGSAFRIHAYNQGKFLVRNRGGVEVLIEDPVKQGEAAPERTGRFDIRANANELDGALTIDEFATMVDSALEGNAVLSVDRK